MLRSDDHELVHVARFARVTLVTVLVGGITLGVFNFGMGWPKEGISILLGAAACGAGLVWLRRGRIELAAAILCASLYWMIMTAAYHGVGIYDAAVFAFPLLIIVATFVLGKRRGLLPATILSVLSVFALSGLQSLGLIEVASPVSWVRSAVAAIIFVSIAWTLRIVRHSWEGNLSELVNSYDNTLRGWAHLLEARGWDVEGHSRRVTELSLALARELRCSPEEMEALERGAYLHDVGKMAIPDAVLLKPAALTAEERSVIETHPQVARDIIADIPFLKAAVCVPYSHHERWDGAGYPQGLKAGEIPRIARIFTVADQFDALSSDRPYRKAWPADEVRTYVQENSGIIYDPQVVDALIRLLDERAEEVMRYGHMSSDYEVAS